MLDPWIAWPTPRPQSQPVPAARFSASPERSGLLAICSGEGVWISPTVEQGQVRSLHQQAAATRVGHVRGRAARRRPACLTGELAAAGTFVAGARGCMRWNESGWLPGQGVTWPMMRRPGASLAAAARLAGHRSPGPPMMRLMQPAAPGCIAMPAAAAHDARRATASAASSLHQVQADHEVPGHRSRTALRQAEGAATPHAAPQAAAVHRNCRMMHQMQFCSLTPR